MVSSIDTGSSVTKLFKQQQEQVLKQQESQRIEQQRAERERENQVDEKAERASRVADERKGNLVNINV